MRPEHERKDRPADRCQRWESHRLWRYESPYRLRRLRLGLLTETGKRSLIRTCRYIDYHRLPLSPLCPDHTYTSANLTGAGRSEPTIIHECPRAGPVAGGTLGTFDSRLQTRTRVWWTIDNWGDLNRLLGASACIRERNTNGGFEI